MITVDVMRNVGKNVEFEIETFPAESLEEAKKIFLRELQNLASATKYPKFSDRNGLVQVRTNRGTLLGEIIVNK